MSNYFLYLKILVGWDHRSFFKVEGVNLLALFIKRIIEDDLQGPKNVLVGEVLVCAHYV